MVRHLTDNARWWLDVEVLGHGCCTGVDEELSHMVLDYHPHVKVEGYPPTNEKYLSTSYYADVVHDPAPYLDRNRAIVEASTVLMGFPAPGSRGTKYTLNYALTQSRSRPRVYIVAYDDGRIVPVREESGLS
jgi:hypothetical protein